jgi:hypothetical protein
MKIRASGIAGCFLWAACLSGAGPEPVRAAAAPLLKVTCAVIDSAGNTLIPARCRVIDCYGYNRYPPLNSLYHTAKGGYFYGDGIFAVSVPPGRVIIQSGRGFEYRERIDTLYVTADTAIVAPLARTISMAEKGWFSGDTHVHINHAGGHYDNLVPGDAALMGRAEGLDVVNCLDNDYHFTGAPASCSTPDFVVFMSEEVRSGTYGHWGALGLRSLVRPTSSTWWPLSMDQLDSCHARPGAVVVSAHPVTTGDFNQVEAWPGSGLARELPVDVIGGRVDAFEVMSYSNALHGGIELDLWYRLLNCGFRIPASAGTDAVMNRLESLPLGGYRVYVRIPGGGFGYQEWLDGLAAGRTFVTNGPLITEFSVEELAPGDTAAVPVPGAVLHGSISVRSLHPVSGIEIVANGESAVAISFAPPRAAIDTVFSLRIDRSAWVAARVDGPAAGWLTVGSRLFAHTSPVYFNVGGERIVDPEDAHYFAEWIASLEALAAEKGSWSSPSAEARVFAELAAAREYYISLAFGGLAGDGGGGAEPTPRIAAVNAPNPFGSGTTIEFDVPGSGTIRLGGSLAERATTVAIYDVAGRLVRRLLDRPLPPGRYRVSWDCRDERGAAMPSGVYFARVSAGEATARRKMILVR